MDDKTRNAAMAALMEMTMSYPVYGVAAFGCGVVKIAGILDPGHAKRIEANGESDDDAKVALIEAEYLKYAGRTLDEGLAEFDAAVRKLPMADSGRLRRAEVTSPLDIPTDTLWHASVRADAVADLDVDDSYLRWWLRVIRTRGRVFLPVGGPRDGDGDGDGYGGDGYGYGYGDCDGYGDGGYGDGGGYGGYGGGYRYGYGGYGNSKPGWLKGVFFPQEAE